MTHQKSTADETREDAGDTREDTTGSREVRGETQGEGAETRGDGGEIRGDGGEIREDAGEIREDATETRGDGGEPQGEDSRVPDPRILNRPVLLLLAASLGALGGFYLLAPVVPLYAATSGAGGVGAGLATGTMMLGTVLTEFAAPGLLRAYGYRAVMGLGLLLLGAPALLLPASASMPPVLGICLARGAGLGLVVVAGAALMAELVPADRRGEGLGLYGVAVGIPSIACLPLGLWLGEHIGHGPVFVAGAASALLALAAVPGLPSLRARTERHGGTHDGIRKETRGETHDGPRSRTRSRPQAGTRSGTQGEIRGETRSRPQAGTQGEIRSETRGGTRGRSRSGILDVLRDGGVARPAIVFAMVTPAAGVLLTFLPLAVPERSRDLVALALLTQSCVTPLARWATGRYGDRHGPARLLVPAVLAAALGTAGLFWVDVPLAMIAGMGLFGAGFGMAQNATLALMFERAPESAFGQVSAAWNLAYDAGLGASAVGFGLLAGSVGYPAGFAVTAAVLFTALAPALYDRTAGSTVRRAENTAT